MTWIKVNFYGNLFFFEILCFGRFGCGMIQICDCICKDFFLNGWKFYSGNFEIFCQICEKLKINFQNVQKKICIHISRFPKNLILMKICEIWFFEISCSAAAWYKSVIVSAIRGEMH